MIEMNGWKGHPRSGMVLLPEGVVLYNGGQRCDMAQGPCACGASHNRLGWLRLLSNPVWMLDDDEKETIQRMINTLDRREQETGSAWEEERLGDVGGSPSPGPGGQGPELVQ